MDMLFCYIERKRIVLTMFINKWVCALACYFMMSITPIFAIVFQSINVDDGLPQSSVNDILQDKTGFIWVATNDGLARYDGINFKNFRSGSGNALNSNNIYHLHYDKNNKLWLSTSNGIYFYNEPLNVFKKITSKIKSEKQLLNSSISSFVIDENFIFAVIHEQPYQYDFVTHRLNAVNFSTKNNSNIEKAKVGIFIQDRQGNIWYLSKKYLYWFDYKSNSLLLVNTDISNKNLTHPLLIKEYDGTFKFYSTGNIWCPEKTNLVINCGKAKLNITYNPLNSTLNAHKNGDYWLGSYNTGLYQYDKTFQFKAHYFYDKNNQHGLLNNDVNVIYIDRQQNIWLSNYGHGIVKIPRSSLYIDTYRVTPNLSQSLSHNHVRSFYQASVDSIWVGTFNGLNHINLKTNEIKHYFILGDEKQISHQNFIRGIVKYNQDNLLILLGTSYLSSPLWLFNTLDKTWRSLEAPRQIHQPSSGFDMVRKGDNLWVAFVDEGLFKLDLNTKTWSKPHWLPKNNIPTMINKLYFDKQQRLWIGDMFFGAFYYNFLTKSLVKINNNTKSHPLNDNWVKSFLQDTKGNMWIGTTNGLHKFNEQKNSIKLYATKDGLSNNTIYGLLEDDKNNLWVSTNAGINRFDTAKGTFKSFHKNNGLQGEEYNTGAFYKGIDNTLYFGGINGFNRFNPQQFYQQLSKPFALIISDIKVFNQLLSTHKTVSGLKLKQQPHLLSEVSLTYEQEIFTVGFTAFNFTDPKSSKYKYRLKGINQKWLEVENNSITFAGLSPGRFLLQLQASNPYFPNNIITKNLTINVSPPWWQNNYAYSLYILMVLAFFSFIYWRRGISLKKHTIQLENAVIKRTHQLNKAIKEKEDIFNHVSHEFRTPLTLINGPVSDLLESTTDPYTIKVIKTIQSQSSYLLRLVNQLLSINATSKIPQNNGVISINKILHSISNHFNLLTIPKQINFNITIGSSLNGKFKEQDIEQIFSNLLSNAIKFTPQGGTISLHAFLKGDDIICKIEDSGCGIPKDEQDKIWSEFYRASNNDQHYIGTGLGLTLVKKLVEKYHGEIYLSDGVNCGCCFVVKLPFHLVIGKSKNIEQPESQFLYAELESKMIYKPSHVDNNHDVNHQNTILIVDDNLTLQQYLVDKLNQSYHCLVAKNGEKGIEAARDLQPDIIISDVMMPIIDGFELCNTLKSDITTSHIPIILLTAKSDQTSRLQGLGNHANVYLNKPFDFNELSLYILNLLNERALLKEYYKNAFTHKHDKRLNISANEQVFINQLNDIIEKHYGDASFQSAFLANEVALSERQLQRKFKSIADITPSQFIRQWRLNKSKEFLLAGQPIGNIALDCGFNSQAYFTKCFKEYYKETPSCFIERMLREPC